MGDKFTLSLTILLTGFSVVFAVLLILIGIIKAYGTVVYKIQNGKREKKISRNADLPKAERDEESQPAFVEAAAQEDDDELIAVISAAVYTVCSPSQVRIKSIRKASPSRGSAWRSAGLSDHIRPF